MANNLINDSMSSTDCQGQMDLKQYDGNPENITGVVRIHYVFIKKYKKLKI